MRPELMVGVGVEDFELGRLPVSDRVDLSTRLDINPEHPGRTRPWPPSVPPFRSWYRSSVLGSARALCAV